LAVIAFPTTGFVVAVFGAAFVVVVVAAGCAPGDTAAFDVDDPQAANATPAESPSASNVIRFINVTSESVVFATE
jgi:hypothetical protein